MKKSKDKFGFLPHKIEIKFGNYLIKPFKSIDSNFKKLKKKMDMDGFIHPPISYSRIPSEIIYRAYDSHFISTIDGSPLPEQFRLNDGAFILGILSLIFETRLQFSGWWHEGRTKIKPSQIAHIRNGGEQKLFGRIIVWDDDLSALFESLYVRWHTLKPISKESVLNSLYFHCKSESYHWGYERFFADYTAMEAIWNAGEIEGIWNKKKRKLPRRNSKKERWIPPLLLMIRVLEMYQVEKYWNGVQNSLNYCVALDKRILSIYRVRNILFHEGRWGKNNRVDIIFKKNIVFTMHQLVQKLILSYLGVRNKFTKYKWWYRGHQLWYD